MEGNLFTDQELRYIESAIRAYPRHIGIEELKNSVLRKVRGSLTASQTHYNAVKNVERIESRPDTVITVDPDKFVVPVFKFLKCPDELHINTILPNEFRMVGDPKLTHVCIPYKRLVISNNNYRTGIALTPLEAEVLIAFAMFHKLKEKGIDCSGLAEKEQIQDTQDTQNSEENQ